MRFVADGSKPDRRVRAFHRLISCHLRLHSELGWAGLIILLLFLAANHQNGWLGR